MDKQLEHMKTLVEVLNRANDAYYNTGTELISNKQWDDFYDNLCKLEKETGIVLSNSPTQHVGYEVQTRLEKSTHDVPALSLDKTKDRQALAGFLGEHTGVLSWKLDGLTVVITYENGLLSKAVTRGNGTVGEIITHNAKVFKNLPLTVPFKGKLVLRGEAVISYADFEKINNSLPEGEEPYKNPRNLCSGSVRTLDAAVAKERNIMFKAFTLVSADGKSFNKISEQFAWLKEQGFDVVEHIVVQGGDQLLDGIEDFEKKIENNPIPTDGLVLQFNDIAYGKSLGRTAKFPKDAMAFKWKDEVKDTTLIRLEWSASRTGLINPVAVFEPVDLEGTTVSRASVHNVSIVKSLALIPGDTISVYKANMIIPQVLENKTKTGVPTIPTKCPVCQMKAVVVAENDTETLRCTNEDCPAKQVGIFVHAVGRDALDINGLSEETLKKLMDEGLLTSLADLFTLKEKKDDLCRLEGFGEKSAENLLKSIEKARHTTLAKLIYSFGIDNIGRTASRAICNNFDHDVVKVVTAKKEDLLKIADIGDTIADSFVNWFANIHHQELFEAMLDEVILTKPEKRTTNNDSIYGKTFVVTGSLNHFSNRDELKALIENAGGKVSGSVSSKTNFLINNDIMSSSTKNKKAKDLGIPIITEDDIIEKLGIIV